MKDKNMHYVAPAGDGRFDFLVHGMPPLFCFLLFLGVILVFFLKHGHSVHTSQQK